MGRGQSTGAVSSAGSLSTREPYRQIGSFSKASVSCALYHRMSASMGASICSTFLHRSTKWALSSSASCARRSSTSGRGTPLSHGKRRGTSRSWGRVWFDVLGCHLPWQFNVKEKETAAYDSRVPMTFPFRRVLTGRGRKRPRPRRCSQPRSGKHRACGASSAHADPVPQRAAPYP